MVNFFNKKGMPVFLLDSHCGFHLIKYAENKTKKQQKEEPEDSNNTKQVNKDFMISSEYLFKTNKEALQNITQITNGDLPESLKLLLENVKSEIICPDKNLKQIVEKVHQKVSVDISFYKEIKQFFYQKREVELQKITYISHKMVANKMAEDINRQDLMVIHAVKIIDDLDKDINIHTMKLREWYSLHFPELSNLITDNKKYLQAVLLIKNKEGISNSENEDLKELVGEEAYNQIVDVSKISMGSDIQNEDLEKIIDDIKSTLSMIDYKIELTEYLEEKMKVIAPNLFNLIGYFMGARMISKAGSLINLSKLPASTVQILGAEKALFSALKGKKDTPKYGYIYHSTFVSKANSTIKGKVARMLGCKISLCSKIDAFSEDRSGEFAITCLNDIQKKIDKLTEQKPKTKSTQRKSVVAIRK